jgi:general secretion pathway protein G
MKKRERGFTLVELLVVIAILGVLGGLAVPRVVGALDEARRNGNIANQAIVQSAVERYQIAEGKWPTQTNGNPNLPATDPVPLVATELVNFLQGGRLPRINVASMPSNATPPVNNVSVVAENVWGLNRNGVVVIINTATPPVQIWPAP